MTVRNIRAHQSRGLLPPPEVRGRTGYYGDEHVARIELIRELQAEGLNLAAIRRLLEGVEHSSAEVLDFTRALRASPSRRSSPSSSRPAELAARWSVNGEPPRPELLEKAERSALLRPVGEDRYEVLSPTLARAGSELAELGVDPEAGPRRRREDAPQLAQASPAPSSTSSSRSSGSPSSAPAGPRRTGPR